MATLKSNLVTRKLRQRGLYTGQDQNVAGRIFFKSGTLIPLGDVLLMVPVGELQAIQKVSVLVLGDLGTTAGSLGTLQILDKDGNPVVVERKGPLADASTKYPSPASVPAALLPAGVLAGYAETVIAAPEKLTGPVNVGITVTTAGAAAEDTELFVTVYFKGEASMIEVGNDTIDGDNEYLLEE